MSGSGFMPPGIRERQQVADEPFEPCAATASLFLYAEGSTVICLHHDSLALERTFEKHTENIQFIIVDNISERGAGRLVVTYDVGKTAIVWDLFTGEQISRFASYEPVTAASWMRNGSLAFGNGQGEIIMFEPATGEHVSARTIFDPITAIAPSADCKTYAIGYQNGTVLLATLQPQFTMLHNLSTSRSPSPIIGLTWHASSTKQKSDMLATHTADGDLRVWSVAKPPTGAAPRVIRALRRSESHIASQNWISWSKNGRIIQYSCGETWAWDVRTKDVTYGIIPTVKDVRGIAAYGATGTLFTLGPDQTIQQYDVDQRSLVADARRAPFMVPQTPPPPPLPAQEPSQQAFTSESESEETSSKSQSRLEAYAAEAARMEKGRSVTPRVTRPRGDSRAKQTMSPAARTDRTATTMSIGTQSTLTRDVHSPVSFRSRKGSRLRQEVIMSPQERPIPDLFPYTRARLSDVPYQQARAVNDTHTTPDDLRHQMLSVVFGWSNDIHALINEELSRLPSESAHAVFLTRWLNSDAEHLTRAMSSKTADPTLNWMRLALNAVGESPGSKKVAQVLVEHMLTQGEVHGAATLLVACGDYNDAVEVYVSRNHYMEAVLLTCLLMPTEWQRLSFLVRKWGEHVIQNGEHHLAVRCFSCTVVEPTDPWTSPTAQAAVSVSPTAPSLQPSIYHKMMERRSMLDGPLSATSLPSPGIYDSTVSSPNGPLSASGLKLVTSFGAKDHYKFPGLLSEEGTPINVAFGTPIAESAAPRSALPRRANNMRSLNAAVTQSAAHRSRLPSVGEATADVDSSKYTAMIPPRAPPTPADSGSDKEREKPSHLVMDPVKAREELPVLLTPARYEPPSLLSSRTPQTAVSTKPPFAYPDNPETASSAAVGRKASRTRKPDGLSLRMFAAQGDHTRAENLTAQAYGESIDRPSTSESMNSMDNPDFASPPHTGNSYASYRSLRSPSVTGRSIDQYISSLDQAQYYKPRNRGNSLSSKQSRDDFGDRRKHRTRDHSIEPTTARPENRHTPFRQRSPSFSDPMSPSTTEAYPTPSMESFESASFSASEVKYGQASYAHEENLERRTSNVASGERHKHRSRSRQPEARARTGSRAPSRRRSPEESISQRGRSKSRRDGSTLRSPSSPEALHFSEDDPQSASSLDPALRIVSQNRHRLHSQPGRRSERSMSTQRPASPDRKSQRLRSRSRQPESYETVAHRKRSMSVQTERTGQRAGHASDARGDGINAKATHNDHRSRPSQDSDITRLSGGQYVEPNRRTKQLAQAELEARRLSLQRRPSAPAVPFPGQELTASKFASLDHPPPLARAQTDTSTITLGSMSAHSSNQEVTSYGRSRPTTPRAMKHPVHGQNASVPDMPSVTEVLNNDVYRPAKTPSIGYTSPKPRGDSFASPEVPSDMPKHPAFDHSIGTSRPSSRNVNPSHRHASPVRGVSRDRSRMGHQDVQIVTIGDEEWQPSATMSSPPLVPELQHLAIPPPPPPPPAPPRDYQMHQLHIQTEFATQPGTLPQTAYQSDNLPLIASTMSPPNVPDGRHRRGQSTNENQIVGKIRTFAGRMRDNSRGRSRSRTRDNPTRSPPINEESYSPYESLPNAAQQAHQQLATVIEGQ